MRELAVVPAVAVNVTPRVAVVPLGVQARQAVDVRVEVVNNADGGGRHRARSTCGAGAGRRRRRRTPFTFARAGERTHAPFTVVRADASSGRDYRIQAVATRRRSRVPRGLRRDRASRSRDTVSLSHGRRAVRGIDVEDRAGAEGRLRDGHRRRGAGRHRAARGDGHAARRGDLARGDLGEFDAIVTGTRAYAVREDLKTYNRRLLDYVKDGGNLIVLYNTQEFVPNQYAPYPGELPARAEEVSEEDSPVEILAPADRGVQRRRTQITKADFDGWVEQRGSKFWSRSGTAPTRRSSRRRTAARRRRGRLADGRLRQGALHVLRLRLSSSAARTASRAPTGCWRTYSRWVDRDKDAKENRGKGEQRPSSVLSGPLCHCLDSVTGMCSGSSASSRRRRSMPAAVWSGVVIRLPFGSCSGRSAGPWRRRRGWSGSGC